VQRYNFSANYGQYTTKVSKKIRFGRPDADGTEEFGGFEAIVMRYDDVAECGEMVSS